MPRRIALAYAVIALIAAIRVGATHRVFSATMDEPVHLLAGWQWLHGERYLMDASHPPLARVIAALPLYLAGIRPSDDASNVNRGNSLLYANGRYEHNVAAARRPLLIFVVIGVVATGLWTARYFGHAAGLLASAMFASLPPLLGNAGLFTTDFSLAAMLPLAWLLIDRLLDRPTWQRALACGLAAGAAAVTKFSFAVFFPVSLIIILLVRRVRVPARAVALACAAAFVVVWGMYRFEWKTLAASLDDRYKVAEVFLPKSKPMIALGAWIDHHIPVPAPLYVVGAGMVKRHDEIGHPSFFLGQVKRFGWWYYFPVVFFFKTPLPFIALSLIGIAIVLKRRRDALALALIPIAVMFVVIPSRINIGVRHILPIYPPLCAVAAFAALAIWKAMPARTAAAALLAWLFIGTALAHPDYLAWFNEAAGKHPEHIVVDSNLDWGQDTLRLVRAVRQKHIDDLRVLYFGSCILQLHGIRGDQAQSFMPSPGWYAISLTALELEPEARRGGYRWLDAYSYEMVGKSIRLYHVEKAGGGAGPPR